MVITDISFGGDTEDPSANAPNGAQIRMLRNPATLHAWQHLKSLTMRLESGTVRIPETARISSETLMFSAMLDTMHSLQSLEIFGETRLRDVFSAVQLAESDIEHGLEAKTRCVPQLKHLRLGRVWGTTEQFNLVLDGMAGSLDSFSLFFCRVFWAYVGIPPYDNPLVPMVDSHCQSWTRGRGQALQRPTLVPDDLHELTGLMTAVRRPGLSMKQPKGLANIAFSVMDNPWLAMDHRSLQERIYFARRGY